MKRRLLNFTVLALCAATMTAWIRSHWRCDGVLLAYEGGRQALSWKQGAAHYLWSENGRGPTMRRWQAFSLPPDLLEGGAIRSFGGFRYASGLDFNATKFAVPFWFLVLVLASPLALSAPSRWRLRAWLPALLLVTACAALWVRSSYTTELWWWTRPNGDAYFAVSTTGKLRLAVQRGLPPAPPGHFFDSSIWGTVQLKSSAGGVMNLDSFSVYEIDRSVFGFGWTSSKSVTSTWWTPPVAPVTAEFRCLAIPYWFLTTLSGLPLAARGVQEIRAHRRRRRGRCAGCGYDLRATPDRCPECGHMPTFPQTAA